MRCSIRIWEYLVKSADTFESDWLLLKVTNTSERHSVCPSSLKQLYFLHDITLALPTTVILYSKLKQNKYIIISGQTNDLKLGDSDILEMESMWWFNSGSVTAPVPSQSSHLPHPLCHSLGEKYRSAGVADGSSFMTERGTYSDGAFYFDVRKTGLMLSILHWCSLCFALSCPMYLVSASASHNLMHLL